MSYQAELKKLADELEDVEEQVIQDIIDYRRASKRTSQTKIGEQFGVDLCHVKKITKFMKKHLDDMDCELDSQSSNLTVISDVEKDAFSSVAELNQYLAGSDDGGGTGTRASTSLERMLMDDSDDEETAAGLTENDPVQYSQGEKFIKYAQWFVNTTDEQIKSLNTDAELFDAERSGFKLKNHKLSETLREKDLEINKLKAELAKANMFHKEKSCIRCDQPKKYSVAKMQFCSIKCIKQATKDLEGSDELPEFD